MANDQTDQPTIPPASPAGGSKDVLFGWLVGRAAADLGLAQVLAASEAQRTEQFKALEVGLLAQIQELRNAPSALSGNSDQTDEFERLKSEMQSLLKRMGGFETAAERFAQTPEILRDEMVKLQAQLGEQQSATKMHHSQLATNADALRERIDELENRQAAKLEPVDRMAAEITELKSNLEPLADRMAHLESTTQTVAKRVTDEIARIEQIADERVHRELATFESEMLARLDDLSDEALTHRFEQVIQNRLELPAGVEQNARSLAALAADHASLRSEIENLSKQIQSATAAPPVDLAGERDRWSAAVDERITVRLRDLGETIRQEISAIGEAKADRERVAAEFVGLAERLTRIENAVESTSVSTGTELNSIRAELSRQQSQLQPAAALLQSLEETLRTEIAAIQDYLGREQQSARTRELQQREFEIQLQRVTQRLKETESMIQQSHALILNEGAQAAQQREALTAELAVLRARIDEPQTRAALDRLEESLRAKIHDELQSQLARNIAGLDRRDDELRDLKAQIKNLAEQMARSERRMPPVPFPLAERILEIAPAVDLVAEAPRENRPSAAADWADSPREAHSSAELNTGWEPALTEGQDPLKSLHERMSADIERARAELREKSGRWKLRR